MFARGGLDRISVDEVAKTAGISKGLLFHYFTNKRGFQLEIVRRASEELLAATAPNRDLTPLDMLRDSIERYVDYVVEHREAYISQLRGPASADPEFVAVFEANRAANAARVLDSLPVEVPDRARLELAVRGWIAFIEETTITWLRGQQISRDELVELNFRALPAVALTPELAAELFGTESTSVR
ncbi:MAG: TetR/AcrR family transcriptional regulator [Aldersonia sp.]|nr:TetR/AcrR family transcriptional regulator [Aldersonia sp.]